MTTMRAFLAVCVFAAACSPFSNNDSFSCTSDPDCNAQPGGMCSLGNLCAYPSTVCPGGYAYGDNAGGMSGMCAPPVGIQGDGGVEVSDAFVAPPDAPPTTACVGSPNTMQICVGLPQMDRDLENETLLSKGDNNTASNCDFLVTIPDTTNVCKGPACTQTGAPALCVIQGQNITLNNDQLRDSSGSRPLVFVATDSITINGTIDATTKRGKTGAPGAASGGCTNATAQVETSGAGGGGGVSFGTLGGNGGSGSHRGGGTAQAAATGTPPGVRSGCRGGGGGNGMFQVFQFTGGGDGGFSGGAVYFLAKNTITINGTIDVSGMGGGAGSLSSGGGGGGPGGLVGLDAATITLTGTIIANGGAGGGAGGPGQYQQQGKNGGQVLVSYTSGNNGKDGGQAQAKGGQGGSPNGEGDASGGDGGDGTDSQNQTGGSGDSASGQPCGGGGGGGGQGAVWIVGTHTLDPTKIIGKVINQP